MIERGSYHWWRQMREVVLREEPTCRIGGPNCTLISTQVDHIIPRAAGGTDERSNLRGSCAPCNAQRSKKVAITAPRGQLFPSENEEVKRKRVF